MPVTIIACYENHVRILVWTPMSRDVQQWGSGKSHLTVQPLIHQSPVVNSKLHPANPLRVSDLS